MPKVHYFQRYSSPENTVTNNTLQLLSRIYSYSPVQASRLLTEITGEPIEIGIEISQQTRSELSVPDGQVIQRSFKVLIEAKVDSPVDQNQLVRHAAQFSNESQQILLLLTKQELNEQEKLNISRDIESEYPEVIFTAITFESICRSVSGLFQDYEYKINEVVDDYIEYCNDTSLFDQSSYLMRIVPCRKSLIINLRYGVYFQPSDRGYTEHSFVGMYANKSVRAIMEIDAVYDIDLVDGQLHKTLIQGNKTDEYNDKIIAIIGAAKHECGYKVAHGHRFFCGIVHETDYKKTSPGGIQGARFENLRELLGEIENIEIVAQKLRAKTWK
ncbi:hypothetical protein ACFL3H_00290 [Gemmatimonadota bacterium]